jgi:hypothetical protein
MAFNWMYRDSQYVVSGDESPSESQIDHFGDEDFQSEMPRPADPDGPDVNLCKGFQSRLKKRFNFRKGIRLYKFIHGPRAAVAVKAHFGKV